MKHRYLIRPIAVALALVLALALAGCQTLPFGGPYDPSMSAKQLQAIAGDRSADVRCVLLPTPWGLAKVVEVSHDEVKGVNGSASVDINCAVITNTATPPKEPKAPVAPKEPAK